MSDSIERYIKHCTGVCQRHYAKSDKAMRNGDYEAAGWYLALARHYANKVAREIAIGRAVSDIKEMSAEYPCRLSVEKSESML